jgi:hypothetical protein
VGRLCSTSPRLCVYIPSSHRAPAAVGYDPGASSTAPANDHEAPFSNAAVQLSLARTDDTTAKASCYHLRCAGSIRCLEPGTLSNANGKRKACDMQQGLGSVKIAQSKTQGSSGRTPANAKTALASWGVGCAGKVYPLLSSSLRIHDSRLERRRKSHRVGVRLSKTTQSLPVKPHAPGSDLATLGA